LEATYFGESTEDKTGKDDYKKNDQAIMDYYEANRGCGYNRGDFDYLG